jgi:hypothetical protein
MPETTFTRRAFLARLTALGVALGAAPLLSACGTPGTTTGGTAKGGVDCTDESALSEADKATRSSLQYVAASEKPDQNCLNCQYYIPPADETTCGTCSLLPGPVTAEGWCASWVAKVS